MKAFRTLLAALAAITLLLSPLSAQENAEGIEVHDPYARVLAGVGASGAVFFTLHNHGDLNVTLTGASSPQAEMAGLHTHVTSADGMMQMIEIEGGVALPDGAHHDFARGGDHVMLMGLTADLKDGDFVTLTLTFDGASPLTFNAVVDNARAPEAMDHGTHDATSG